MQKQGQAISVLIVSTPNIIHTMKHTVKARVLTINTEIACPCFCI